MLSLENIRLSVIGLGYVGLPLAVEFGMRYPTLGYDIDSRRIADLKKGYDRTRETSSIALASSSQLILSNDVSDLENSNVYILTLPTPINEFDVPDLSLLLGACKQVGAYLETGNIVIFESTVYPGATEEQCVPILQTASGLILNEDFYVGYSPERISPGGDKALKDIVKVTSGSTEQAAIFIDSLYKTIIRAGTYLAPSIRIAEASKIIENTQRDINIAFINQTAILFHAMGLNTQEVLKAAQTKWNFLDFTPGLVGGHCIGVDPYYLLHKANQSGVDLSILRAGRTVNDHMGKYVATQVMSLMSQKNICIPGAHILVLGVAFKENCTDIRNSRVIDIINSLQAHNAIVEIFDPVVDPKSMTEMYDLDITITLKEKRYDAIVVAVPHQCFLLYDADFYRTISKKNSVIYDLKGIYHAAGFTDGEL
jgi:UDP-N-acetyl-D-galactosamine dehydrogenase